MATERPFRTVFLDPDFRRDPKTAVYCCVCQRDIKGEPRFFARIVDAGASAVHPDDEHQLDRGAYDDLEDLGVHPVGDECARRIGREWLKTFR